MKIDDTVQTLAQVRQSIDSWVPRTAARSEVLIADLNELYVASTDSRSMEDLFEYIAKQMIEYAIEYVKEVKASAKGGTDGPETE
jgi:hypothetical protein